MDRYYIETPVAPRLCYRKSGTGPPIVLLHGFPEDGSLWEPIGAELSRKYTVIIPDIPGSGESELAGNPSIEDLAEPVSEMLRAENLGPVMLVGHSMGGYIALAFAEKFPSMLAGLSLVHSTAAADTEEKKETRRKSIELIRKWGKKPFIEQMIPALFAKDFRNEHPAIIERQIDRGMKLKEESMIAFYTAMINRPDRTGNLVKSAIPLQWIIGKEDSVVPVTAALKRCSLSDISFVSLYEGCGHMSMIEQPGRLLKDLEEFGGFCLKN